MSDTLHLILTTSAVTFLSGFALGVFAIRGYVISPALKAERRGNLRDPVESDESDIDEDDTILDHAPNWANGEAADRRDGLRQEEKKKDEKKAKAVPIADAGKEECKLVLVVRTDLGMTKGKMAAQSSHATLACYKVLARAAAKNGPSSAEARLLDRWERLGQAKIAVQIKGEDELKKLRAAARAQGVTAEVIADAGRTQIEAGSLTVLGVGPAPKSLVDKITGHLKLL
ncbi:Peptidyl-tRNA hydrolase 2 like protein [Verticillium longisporum]|uniref:peptidyl-tRNA hydrolase n=1 Tax=Verticillium longisporum TaxID=100787 RepID=A0A8I2Z9W5_VERLO|nr:Peptidyl-tRNA hydrolase 2 like protein [Verticillium longisporum]